MATQNTKIGTVVEVIGPVVDVQFQEHHLPLIHSAVRITSEGFDVPEPLDIVAEVEQHLGESRVRCVAMKPTEGLVRGMKAEDSGRAYFCSRGTWNPRPSAQCARRAGRQTRRGEGREAIPDSPSGALSSRAVHESGNVRSRNQSGGPDRAVPE